jgi:hypothetical protein
VRFLQHPHGANGGPGAKPAGRGLGLDPQKIRRPTRSALSADTHPRRECPRGGSRRMHTDCGSVQHARTGRLGSTQLVGKPLIIEAQVPLVMERRKRVGQG